jgi:2-amino-4-hydroxy-6-hydroxymethyldihydropteridine diphosphokinase
VILGLGSNIDPAKNIIQALTHLRQQTDLLRVSNTWESAAAGSDGPNFLNAAACIETSSSMPELKQDILRPIEARMGRVRTVDKNAPRTIDIDILFYDGDLVEPAVWDFAFLAVPVAELMPDFKRPQSGERLQEAAERLAQASRLKHRPDVIPGLWAPKENCN